MATTPTTKRQKKQLGQVGSINFTGQNSVWCWSTVTYILATVLEIQGEGADAIKTEYEAIETLRMNHARLNLRVALDEEKAGDTLFNEEAFREAEKRYSSAIFAALLAIQDDRKVLRRLNEKLGRTVAAQKRNKEADVYFRRAERFDEAK